MKRSQSGWLGQLSLALGLCVACNGQLRSLGEKVGTAGSGAAGSDAAGSTAAGSRALTGGTAGSGAAGGDAAGSTAAGNRALTGGTAGSGAAGSDAAGSTAAGSRALTGGTAGSGAAGLGANTVANGGASGFGTWLAPNTGDFVGGGTTSTVAPYLQDPTTPIDPTCTCSSTDQICNAERECVPRCDSMGRCAMWLAPGGIVDIFADGSTVYYASPMQYDPLGNPVGNGALYRVDFPDGTPSRVAELPKGAIEILGRYNGSTLVAASESDRSINVSVSQVVRITDSGISTTLFRAKQERVSISGSWLVYVDVSGDRLWKLDLEANSEPQLLVELTSTPAELENSERHNFAKAFVLDDYVWYLSAIGTGWDSCCRLDRSNLAAPPTCAKMNLMLMEWEVGSKNQIFTSFYTMPFDNSVMSMDLNCQEKLKLFDGNAALGGASDLVFFDDWLYLVTGKSHQLVRVPTTVGRLPQEVLPAAVVSDDGNFVVSSAGLFWYDAAVGANQSCYIFHAPLPPQPCDAQLPCSEAGQLCENGFCKKS